MPVIAEGSERTGRSQRLRLWWLLAFPVFGVVVLTASAVRPLELGGFVLVTTPWAISGGSAWGARFDELHPLPFPVYDLRGRGYEVSGSVHRFEIKLGSAVGRLSWFRGRWLRDRAE